MNKEQTIKEQLKVLSIIFAALSWLLFFTLFFIASQSKPLPNSTPLNPTTQDSVLRKNIDLTPYLIFL
jgi:hypothetical protein